MRPQLFENVQGRGFREVAAEESGPFFSGRYLGRGLAILDWNGDGCPDAAISHLHAPLALLTNHADRGAGHSQRLVLRLAGRTGCREPVGASVTVRAGASEFTSLQTAGGGFLTSNDPRHLFALPTNFRLASARVTWPDGHSQTYEDLQVGSEYIHPERRSQAMRVRTLRTPE
jgi:hypothetical protein